MMNEAEVAKQPTKSNQKGFWGLVQNNWAVSILSAAAVLVLVVIMMTVFGGGVSGEQFCPELFQRRHFAYRQVPGFRFQVTPVRYFSVTNDLELFLANGRYIPLVTGGKPRWDLVSTDSIVDIGYRGDAADLCDYLDQYDGNGARKWLEWTKNNASLARVLWPAIAEVTKENLYYFCPDLLQLAEMATDTQAFQKQVDRLLADKYTRLANAKRQLDQPASASRFYRLALIRVVDHRPALQGLSKLQQADAVFHITRSRFATES